MEVEQCDRYFRVVLPSCSFHKNTTWELKDVNGVECLARIQHNEGPTAGDKPTALLFPYIQISLFIYLLKCSVRVARSDTAHSPKKKNLFRNSC